MTFFTLGQKVASYAKFFDPKGVKMTVRAKLNLQLHYHHSFHEFFQMTSFIDLNFGALLQNAKNNL